MQAKAAYIHIPFCKKICHYCAFNKFFYDGQPVGDYLAALDQEMATYDLDQTQPLDTLYIGGGTPSCLSLSELGYLLASIHRRLPLKDKTEFSFEINPGELSLEKCRLLKDQGGLTVSVWGSRPSMTDYCVKLDVTIGKSKSTNPSTGFAR